jgi:hypothetical protein
MKRILELRDSGKVSEYYRALEDTLEDWKLEYRRSME